MDVTKIVLFDWSAVFESFLYKFLERVSPPLITTKCKLYEPKYQSAQEQSVCRYTWLADPNIEFITV